LCNQGLYAQAYQIVQHYAEKQLSEKPITEHTRQAYSFAYRLYCDKYYNKYDSYGICNEYAQDPMYVGVIKDLPTTMIPRFDLNAYFYKRSYDGNNILQCISIKNPSSIIKNIAYDLIEIQKNGPAKIAEYLAYRLSTNSTNPDICDAYTLLYHDNGLPKIFAYKGIEKLKMPASIGMDAHARDRILLFELTAVEPKNAQQAASVEQGIECIQKACEQELLSESYRSLAESSCYAARQEAIEPIILSYCTQILCTEKHKKIQALTLPVVAKLHNALYNVKRSSQEQDTLIRIIKKIDNLYGNMLKGSADAEKTLMRMIESHITFFSDRQNEAKKTNEEFSSQILALEQYSQVSITLPEIALQRAEALKNYKTEGDARVANVISLSEYSRIFLAQHGIYPLKFITMHSNALQRNMQQEICDIAEKTALQYYSKFKEAIALANAAIACLIDIGIDYTLQGDIVQAQIIADGCSNILTNIGHYINELPDEAIRAIEYKNELVNYSVRDIPDTDYMDKQQIKTADTSLLPSITCHIGKITVQVLAVTHNKLLRIKEKTMNYDGATAKFETLYASFQKNLKASGDYAETR
jgi:hypothetical protein